MSFPHSPKACAADPELCGSHRHVDECCKHTIHLEAFDCNFEAALGR